MDINKVVALAFMSILLSSCAGYGERHTRPLAQDLIACDEPRPQICTREYNPVCATYKDGSKKTGATGCTACSDPEVVSYTMGVCKTDAVD